MDWSITCRAAINQRWEPLQRRNPTERFSRSPTLKKPACAGFFWFIAEFRGRRRRRTSRRRAFGAHPRCSDSPPRFVAERPLRGPCSYWPTAAPLVRNSPRGWTPKALPSPEVHVGRAKARGSIVGRHASTGARRVLGNRVLATASASPRGSGSGRDRRRHHATDLLPINRIVVRGLGVHPRGEFRTSGAAVGQIDTWAAKRPSAPNAEDCLSSEGGRQGLPRETPKCRERWRSRAMREVRGARCEVRRTVFLWGGCYVREPGYRQSGACRDLPSPLKRLPHS
ncbi:hypothetical protein C8J98_104203 [Luteibacter sp. OK325]|nr:hypothetical protein C8J98_104203 [Luteibacter sp. OK325]